MVTVAVVVRLLGRLFHNGRLGGCGLQHRTNCRLAPFSQSAEAMKRSRSSVEPEDLYRG